MPESAVIKISRDIYIKKYGPTIGDRICLGDTNLIAEIEKDFTNYGDELTFGIGKVTFFIFLDFITNFQAIFGLIL
jgi:hypothetical protein